MTKTVAIHQPNFLPWLGYFHKMIYADVFVLLDDVQFPKGSYANRVKIKSSQKGAVWLTVPVRLSKGSHQRYNEIEIASEIRWQASHASLLRNSYSGAPYFDYYFDDLVALEATSYPHLAALNTALIRFVRDMLGIDTPLIIASALDGEFGTGSERNLRICEYLGGNIYLSGQGARAYNDATAFSQHGIALKYQRFTPPIYPQVHGGFVPRLSVIDLLFNCGPRSKEILASACYGDSPP